MMQLVRINSAGEINERRVVVAVQRGLRDGDCENETDVVLS